MAELAPVQAELDELRQASSLHAIEHEQALHDLASQLEQAQQASTAAQAELGAARAREAGLSGEKDRLAAELAAEKAARAEEERGRADRGKDELEGEKARRELVEALERSELDKDQLKGRLPQQALRLVTSTTTPPLLTN